MKYIICKEPGKLELKEKSPPVKGEGEALVKIKKVGICGTDLHAYAGKQSYFTYPRILGHELAGEILEINSNKQNMIAGDKVLISPYISCGNCIACANGKTNCCVSLELLGIHVDGGMQELIKVPIQLLYPANNLSFNEIAIIEPLAIGAHAIRRSKIKLDDVVVVTGCGPIGIGIIKFAQISGATVIAMDINQKRLNYVKKVLNVDFIVNATQNPIKDIENITQGNMASIVFDATGHKGSMEMGPRYMAHGGKLVLVGHTKGQLAFQNPYIHAKEITLLSSRNATTEDLKYVMKILSKGMFPTESYITHNVDFKEMISNFVGWLDPNNNVIKATVDF